jgi:hypothetical protein
VNEAACKRQQLEKSEENRDRGDAFGVDEASERGSAIFIPFMEVLVDDT